MELNNGGDNLGMFELNERSKPIKVASTHEATLLHFGGWKEQYFEGVIGRLDIFGGFERSKESLPEMVRKTYMLRNFKQPVVKVST